LPFGALDGAVFTALAISVSYVFIEQKGRSHFFDILWPNRGGGIRTPKETCGCAEFPASSS
jgi:hypothetical protein